MSTTQKTTTTTMASAAEGDELFEVPQPNVLEMIHMESSMRLWSGCYKSSWLRVEELEPSAFLRLNKGPDGRGGGEGGAFEILKVFLASLNDGKTQEIKVHICGFDPVSNSWISVGDDATLCYKNHNSLEASTSSSSTTSSTSATTSA